MNVMTIELSNRKFLYLWKSNGIVYKNPCYATLLKIIENCHFLGIFLKYSHRKVVGQINIRIWKHVLFMKNEN